MATMTMGAKNRQWRRAVLSLAVLIAVILWGFWGAAVSMVEVWASSTTFNHGFLIPLISLWLIWGQRHALMEVTPSGSLLGLAGMLGAGLLWLAGTVSSVQVAQHLGLVLMIQSAFLAVWGWPALRCIFFAVAYLLFAVPFGDFLTSHLQSFTATFVVEALRVMDIPVYSDGIFISIPTGNFEVAEACAGLRFLIATVAIGTLFSYLSYKSWTRKIVFVALSFIIPVIANGFRALGIVLLAYYSNNQLAVGVDHIIYGWGFFAAVLILLLFIGSRFSDKPVGVEETHISPGDQDRPGNGLAVLIYSAVGLVIASLGPAYAQYIILKGEGAHVMPVLPQTPNGWTLLDEDENPLGWHPTFVGNSRETLRTYSNGEGQVVEVYAAVYDTQLQGAELVSYANSLVSGDSEWRRARSGEVVLPSVGPAAYTRITNLRDSANIYYWYWVDDQMVTSDIRAKLLYAKGTLLGGNPSSGVLSIAVPTLVSEEAAHAVASEFLNQLAPLQSVFINGADIGVVD